MVDSHCVGVEKPDPAIFRTALERLDATPEKTVFIGDSLHRDREGARRVGMRFIRIAPQSVQAAQTGGHSIPRGNRLADTCESPAMKRPSVPQGGIIAAGEESA